MKGFAHRHQQALGHGDKGMMEAESVLEEVKEEVTEETIHEPEYYERTGEPYPRAYKTYIDHYGKKKGLEMYKAMKKWRTAHDIDHILDQPDPKYWLIKENAPHYMYGKTKTGAWVSYELSGRIDPNKLSKAGVKAEDIERHIAFNQEFVRKIVDKGVEKTYMVVMDMKGFTILKATNLFFLSITRTYGNVSRYQTLSKYYTGVLDRLVVVNPPTGAKAIYNILMAVLPGIFGEKVIIKIDPKALLEWIDADQLPVEYGGTNRTPLWESDVENAIHAHVAHINQHVGGSDAIASK